MDDTLSFVKVMAAAFVPVFVIAMFFFFNHRISTLVRLWLEERDARAKAQTAAPKASKESSRASDLIAQAQLEAAMHKKAADELQARLHALDPYVDRIKLYPDLAAMQEHLALLGHQLEDLKQSEAHHERLLSGQLAQARELMASQLEEEGDSNEDPSGLARQINAQYKQMVAKGSLLLEATALNKDRLNVALADEELLRFVIDHLNFIVADALESRTRDALAPILVQVKLALGALDRVLRRYACVRLDPALHDNRCQFVTYKYQEYMRAQARKEEARELREKEREEKIVAKQRESARKEAADQARQQEELKAKVAEKEQEFLLEMRAREEELKHASAEQKAQLQAHINTMEALHRDALEAADQKYAELEESRLRKQSLAEQTTQGHIYIISNRGSFGEQVHKIGMTRREDPEERVRELSDASVPFNFKCHALVKTNNAPLLEHDLHARFAGSRLNKVNMRKEFFKVPLETIMQELKRAGHTVTAPNFKLIDDHALSLAKEQVVAPAEAAELSAVALGLGSAANNAPSVADG